MSIPGTSTGAARTKAWTRTINARDYTISNDKTLLSHEFLHDAFSDEAMYWCADMPQQDLATLVENSCCFGLYLSKDNGSQEQIGLARLVTDHVSIAYLTDVYVEPAYRALGLGKWLTRCCNEHAAQLPQSRGMFLLAHRDGPAVPFYARELDMHDLADDGYVCMANDGPGRRVL